MSDFWLDMAGVLGAGLTLFWLVNWLVGVATLPGDVWAMVREWRRK